MKDRRHNPIVSAAVVGRVAKKLRQISAGSWAETSPAIIHAAAAKMATPMNGAKRRTRLRNYVGAPLREFRLRYLTNGGWRDGWVGLVLALVMAWYAAQTFVYLARLDGGSR